MSGRLLNTHRFLDVDNYDLNSCKLAYIHNQWETPNLNNLTKKPCSFLQPSE